LDRLTAIVTGSETIRETIAFPKTQKGTCLLSGAPSRVEEQQLKEIGLEIKGGNKHEA
jgi:aspartyl-tRNA synthetase